MGQNQKIKIWRKEIKKKLDKEWILLSKVIKPKPKWIPAWLWKKMLKIFIKDIEIKY